ncbi:hypothetical protein Bca52824_082713 [Brassica carinata]|uniref:CW-type domain-containing protein n=1 Tax=Brassica carinata TaxID=52824 RepID=A0A8X7PKC9_BRACI|nr:hypothetical protein Bca52824_082713 [Brassica carinata]
MEESELEEGEACSYNLTNDFGSSFDPDNDLSYIDHKLQNILGHFQKDFEGDFSAENLGAKFGGYGSFLPTYQRSPLWSYPKAPAKPQSSAGTRSPNILPGESQSGNAASSSLPKTAKSELTSSRIPQKSVKSKKPNSSSRHESATKKPGVFSKQNSLKLRIKMGSDSLPAEKNAAAIYSGLGLDVSPNSVSGSEGMSGEPQGYSPLESPTNILNVMTSLPVDPCQLLSPLSNDLIRFIERGKPEKGYKRTSPSRLFIERYSAMANRPEPQKAGENLSLEKNRKMLERNNLSAEASVRSKKGLLDGNDGSVKKPTETNTSYPSGTEKETASSKLFDASKENYNGSLKGDMEVGEYKGSKALEPPHHENPKTSSAGSVRGDKKNRFGDDDASGRSRKEYKGSVAPELVKKETEASKLKSGHKEHSSRKQKSDQIEREPQSSSKFSKQKSSVVNETKMNGQSEKKEVAALKPHNGGKKAEDTYKDFFGDIDDSEEEVEPPTLEDTPEKSRVPVTESQNVGPGPSLGKLGSDPSLPKANPVVIEEHWVACDKCGQWRLLPFGPVPKLPEKWMCTMLDWLPGANYCDVPEDETTKAVYAMYQIPAPDSQAPVQSNPSGLKPQFNQGDNNTKKKRKGFKKLDNGMVKEGSRTEETSKKSILTSARNGIMHNSHGLKDVAEEERQKHKHKERGKAVDHHSDHDSRSLKMNNKRNADQESSMLAKKMKIESFPFPDEGGASDSGVPVASADKKHKPRVSSKMPKEEGGASDTGNSNSTGGSRKRKLKESHGSPRVYRENENHERKKARVLKGEKEPSFSHGSGKSEKKNKSHSRREYGHVAATSSSSHKPRNSSHEVKSSPVESVSSSPMRKKKVDSHDTDFLAASTMRRFSDGEGDGGSDRSQTRTKNKHGFHESSVLDVCDNKGSLKAKVRAEPSLDANLENGGHKDHIHGEGKKSSDHHRRSNDSLAKKSGKGSSSRDGPRHIEKKINDGSSPDMVVKPNIPKPYDVERVSERSNRADLTSPSRPPSRGDSSRKKVEKCGTSAGNNSIQADDVTKATAQVRRRNEPSPSPLRKEVTSVQAAHNILKEAKDLKHTADRLKSSISNLEFIELYFQACLKFLHGAFLLETSSNESARQGETMIHSTSIYSSTANLCGFCAREYEKSKEMGAAALAYKCMEAGYMRVLNSSYTSANRYRNELQTSLQIVPPGESPSSSASDVDNVNNPAAVDRVGNSRCTSSPLVAGNHVISAQNRSNILRIIQFAQNVNLAMDASRKSRVALAASIENLGEDQQHGEGVLSIKSTLDYNFQDLEGLLRLVKLAMKANNR